MPEQHIQFARLREDKCCEELGHPIQAAESDDMFCLANGKPSPDTGEFKCVRESSASN